MQSVVLPLRFHLSASCLFSKTPKKMNDYNVRRRDFLQLFLLSPEFWKGFAKAIQLFYHANPNVQEAPCSNYQHKFCGACHDESPLFLCLCKVPKSRTHKTMEEVRAASKEEKLKF